MSPRIQPPIDRFLSKIEITPDCWVWTGERNPGGYGLFVETHVPFRHRRAAHRWLYEQIFGLLSDGLQLDHLCRMRLCVRPSHLEPVTSAENTARGMSGFGNLSKTHCPRGHEYTEANTYRPPTKPRERKCRACFTVRRAARKTA